MDIKDKIKSCVFYRGGDSFDSSSLSGFYFYWLAERMWVKCDDSSIGRAADLFFSYFVNPLDVDIPIELLYFLFSSFVHSVGQSETPQSDYSALFTDGFLPIYLEKRKGM